MNNTLLDLQNSSHPTRPHSIIAKYNYSGDIEILALSLAENGVIFRYNTSDEVIIAGEQILKIAVSRFVDVSEEKVVSQQILTTVMTRIVIAKPHSICFVFYHSIKDNERNLCQHLFTIENNDSDLKVHALHYANDLLVRAQQFAEAITKELFGKRIMTRTRCR